MESRGGRRMGIRGGGAKDTPLIDPIMLRFRPIAPKPATTESTATGTISPDSLARPVSRRKVKRKYVRVQKKNQCNDSRSVPAGAGELGSDSGSAVEGLHLFSPCKQRIDTDPLQKQLSLHKTLPGSTFTSPDPKVVESLVTVESFGTACGGENHVGSLELDTCPSFVTDYSFLNVLWVNEAYTRLVSGGEASAAAVAVRLVVKEVLPQCRPSFTCQVRVEHTWQNRRYSKLVPCDVWRVDYWGGFAWRLDVKTALSLGFS